MAPELAALRSSGRIRSETRDRHREIGIERSPSSVGCLGEKTDRPISQRCVDRYHRRLSADIGEKSVGLYQRRDAVSASRQKRFRSRSSEKVLGVSRAL